MTPIERQLRELVAQVAPDVEPASIEREVAFREQFDFDSMDQLNLAIAIHEALGVEVPERDYPALASLASAEAYVGAALTRVSRPA